MGKGSEMISNGMARWTQTHIHIHVHIHNVYSFIVAAIYLSFDSGER